MRRRTGVTPGRQGRFDGYNVLGQVPTWDEVTAGVVLRRLGPPAPMRFFTPAEEAVAGALFDHLLDQWEEPKVPVLAMVLAYGYGNGQSIVSDARDVFEDIGRYLGL